ncbi:FAD/NAD(P)-binding domain-containing protein [Violaceomyces palustris]|uniref:FAD/NAD(P)-binding domain-containing protein n=1 Tax=Violaceomyces palustris TaxID=1673888 RepID=A0ACD0NPZ6_9BASI|nr:FAD/NAD(P)-binding domain-containing protein [Violaceomyces palustris]
MRIAIVGGGVSGLSTLWALNEHPAGDAHQIHLFESGDYIGGHTNTIEFQPPPSTDAENLGRRARPKTQVDTGFIVFNRVTYPNFLNFLNLVRIPILDSDMSFSVTRRELELGSFEWAGSSPGALFCQKENLLNPSHWRMVWEIIKFNYQALHFIRSSSSSSRDDEVSIGTWLDQRGYGKGFINNYLIPMTASIWSTAPSTALHSFPALTLLRFMHNHHLLQILDRPQWLTIKGGSKNYVDRILSKFPRENVHKGADGRIVETRKVKRVRGEGESETLWVLRNQAGQEMEFDKVVFACHADTTLKILEGALPQDDEVRKTLAEFKFSENVAVTHCDVKLMPVRRQAWSAWNFLAENVANTEGDQQQKEEGEEGGEKDIDRVSLTYWMNLLQSIPESEHGPVLVTLNPSTEPGSPYRPDPEKVVRSQSYTHPIYTSRSVSAQRRLSDLQGGEGLYFAGAWTNYGFHEDGFTSGLRVATSIGSRLPFQVVDAEREDLKATAAVEPNPDVALRIIQTLDSIARSSPFAIASSLLLIIAIAFNLFLEILLNLLLPPTSGTEPGLRKSLRTVRRFWEQSLQVGQSRGASLSRKRV